ERSLLRDDRKEVAVQHLHHLLYELDAHAGIAEREHVRTKEEHGPRLLLAERRPDGDRVGTEDARLKLRDLLGRDVNLREAPEAGGDAVDGFVRRDDALDDRAGGAHALHSSRGELHGLA